MPRATTTSDVFNAIAEPRRREILTVLAQGDRTVTELLEKIRVPQPAMSKHLGVLRKVGLVSMSKQGQHRLYRFNGQELQPVHEWVKAFERFWTLQLDRIQERAERKARERARPNDPPTEEK